MKLTLDIESSNKTIKVEFIPELAVSVKDLYLLSYEYDAIRYICFNNNKSDIRVDEHSRYEFNSLKHIIYGHFGYENQKIGGQIGAYVSKLNHGGLEHVLLYHDFCGVYFKSRILEDMTGSLTHLIIDLEDFNKARNLIGQERYTLYDYLELKLSISPNNDLGLSLNDETALFSPVANRYDKSNIWSIKGMSMYLEDLVRKSNSID